MRRFTCQSCGSEVYYRSGFCVTCGHRLGFLSEQLTMTALEPEDDGWRALAGPGHWLLCANSAAVACNWLVPADDPTGFCPACDHNRTVPHPDLTSPGVTPTQRRWRDIETAKRQLFWSIYRWKLPHPLWTDESVEGLGFDFLADPKGDVLTGHDNGIITLTLAEADAAELARRRLTMGERYRTLLGHFRHEVGHYYWDILVRDGGRLEEFRSVFGDERPDYGEALKAHYENGPKPDWAQYHISSYAAAHPWEDFAETWAHWTHMVDGLETVQSYGLWAGDKSILIDPYTNPDAQSVIDAWVPYTIALNAANRSMGQPDLYPFVLSRPVEAKLAFINALILGA